MPYQPKKDFKELAEEIKSSGHPQKLTVRELLAHFHQERRGKRAIPWIRKNISNLGLECDPDFENVYIDTTIELKKRPTVKAQKPDKEEDIKPDKDPVPRIALLPAANNAPISIKRDAELQRAITLMLMHDFSQPPENDRDVDGMISWRSIITAQIVDSKLNIVRDCLDRKISIVKYDDRLFDAVKTEDL